MIFFFSDRPSALGKRGKRLFFTPNISTGDGGVHRHQAIVPFLLYYTTTNHGAFNFTSLYDAILQLPRLSAYILCQYIALITRVVARRRFRVSNFWLPHLSFVSYVVVRLRMSHNELHCKTIFFETAVCYFMTWISHFFIYW